MTGVLTRLGHVIGWISNGLAVILAGLAAYSLRYEVEYMMNGEAGRLSQLWLAFFILAIIVFLLGRGLRYIFAGPAEKTLKKEISLSVTARYISGAFLLVSAPAAAFLWIAKFNEWSGGKATTSGALVYAIVFSVVAWIAFALWDDLKYDIERMTKRMSEENADNS